MIHTHAAYNSKIKELPGGVYTSTSLVPSAWDVDVVDSIPLMKQLRSIYKTLEIRFPDGSVITLDTIGSYMARKFASAHFCIQIWDPKYNMIWKPVKRI